jgi:hypothetical protein
METEIIQGHNPLDYTKESIKLVRNSKGYTWEYKIVGTDKNGLITDEDLKRLKKRNEELEEEYGGLND